MSNFPINRTFTAGMLAGIVLCVIIRAALLIQLFHSDYFGNYNVDHKDFMVTEDLASVRFKLDEPNYAHSEAIDLLAATMTDQIQNIHQSHEALHNYLIRTFWVDTVFVILITLLFITLLKITRSCSGGTSSR
jgi:hypothetical protein